MRPKGSKTELELRRRKAVALLAKGRGVREVANLVGSSPSSVSRWKKAYETGGAEALDSKRHPGSRPRLSKGQRTALEKLLSEGPLAHGFHTDLWTLPRVAELIERHFAVRYHPGHVPRILRSLGWSLQKPSRRARERDESAIRAWRKNWPHIKKRRTREP